MDPLSNGHTTASENLMYDLTSKYSHGSLFTLATCFFEEKKLSSDNDIPYDLSVDLSALSKQATHGRFRPDVNLDAPSPRNGVTGVSGIDPDASTDLNVCQAWQNLGETSREEAVVLYISRLAGHFGAGIYKFLQSNSDKLVLRSQETTVNENGATGSGGVVGGSEAADDEDVDIQVDFKGMQLQEDEVRELINEQTESQFKQYVEQEHPQDTQKQEELMMQLKEQQYQQYIQYVYNRLLVHQQMQYDQLAAVHIKKNKLRSRRSMSDGTGGRGGLTNGMVTTVLLPHPPSQSDQNQPQTSLEDNNQNNQHTRLTPEAAAAAAAATPNSQSPSQNESNGMEPFVNGQADGDSTADTGGAGAELQKLPDVAILPASTGARQPTDLAVAARDDEREDGDVGVEGGGGGEESDLSESELNEASLLDILDSNISLAPIPPPLLPASLWTRPDIAAFKKDVQKKENGICGTMKVSSLSSATIKVPTHTRARYVCWEFATDYYDLAFGLEFEWLLTPGDEVTVHMSESDEEEEEDYEEGNKAEGGEGGGDPESGRKPSNNLPVDEVIPIYRRDCHKEVFCGNHLFPGNGVYHLRFDNSFSLWRSKWVYYRIYYSK